MAAGLGGFAQGLAGGLQAGIKTGLDMQKNEREREAFEMEKQIKQNQIDEMNRKKSMNEQIAKGMADLNARLTGGVVGGEAEDEFGQSVGKVEYSTPAEAKASGLKFKQGTAVEKKGEDLTQTEIDRMRANIFQKARIDNNFFDEEAFQRHRQLSKDIEKEGVMDAFRVFDKTQDSDKAVNAFNKAGGMQLPKGAYMKREADPETGLVTNVVYAPGADGKPQRITSSFEIQLMYMPDEMVKYAAGMSKEKFVQGSANKRTNMEVKGRVDAALIGASKDGKSGKDRIKERIDKYAVDFSGKLISNPSISYNVEEFRRQQPQIAARAYQYMTGRVPGQKEAYDDEALALDQATQDILGKPKK